MRKGMKLGDIFCGNLSFPEKVKFEVDNLLSVCEILEENINFSHKGNQQEEISKYKEGLVRWYYSRTGKILNLSNPCTFNEKIQWLKLYDSTPVKTRLADKYLVREWVKEQIGEQYLIPLLGVYDSFDDINFADLPQQFVLKCNHGSGYNIIVKDKAKLDLAEAKAKIDKWMNENFAFKAGFELHYRDIQPKIIIEKYMDDGTGDLRDYKYTCFDGKPEFIWIDSDRHTEHKRNLYDLNWKQLPYKVNSGYATFASPARPQCLEEMTRLAGILSRGFPYVRVDFYVINGKIYFGEMTFTSSSGTEDIQPASFDRHLSGLLKLPKLAYNIDTGEYYKLPKPNRLKPYLLFPYYLVARMGLRRKYKQAEIKTLKRQLAEGRVDIKNFGAATNAVTVSSRTGTISYPLWFTNTQGKGAVFSCNRMESSFEVACSGAGKLRLEFRAPDKRENNQRFPVWADYRSIRVNGKEILSAPVAVWHDKPYRFEMPVKDGQTVKVVLARDFHSYGKDELTDVLLKLNPKSDYVRNHIKLLTKKLHKKLRGRKSLRKWLFSTGRKGCKKKITFLGITMIVRDKHLELMEKMNELQRTPHDLQEKLSAMKK